MNNPTGPGSNQVRSTSKPPQTIVIQQTEQRRGLRSWIPSLLCIALGISVLLNFGLLATYEEY